MYILSNRLAVSCSCVVMLVAVFVTTLVWLTNRADDPVFFGQPFTYWEMLSLDKNSEALAPLTMALADKNESIRSRACCALAVNYGTDIDPIVPQLIRLLTNNNPDVRATVLSIIALTSPVAITALVQIRGLAKHDPAASVREAAARTAACLEAYCPTLNDEEKVIVMRKIDAVLGMTRDNDPRRRYYAIRIIEQLDHSDRRLLKMIRDLK